MTTITEQLFVDVDNLEGAAIAAKPEQWLKDAATRLRDALDEVRRANLAQRTDADPPPPLEINGVAYQPASWREAYELVAAAMRAVAADKGGA